MSSPVELGCESWTSFASTSCSSAAVQRTLSVLVTLPQHGSWNSNWLAQCTSRWVWRGDTALTLPWQRSTVSPVFFGQYPRSSLHSFVPFPVPNKSPPFYGRKEKWSRNRRREAWFSIALPASTETMRTLGRTAQDGHLDSLIQLLNYGWK